MMQDKQLLMLHWRSVLGWGDERAAFLFAYQDEQYIHFRRIFLGSPEIADSVRLQIVDAPLTLTFNTF